MGGEDPEDGEKSTGQLMLWAEDHGMRDIPVLDAWDFNIWPQFEAVLGNPSITHLGPDMRVLSMDEGIADPTVFW